MPGRATNEPTNYLAFAKQSAKDTEGSTFHFLKQLDGSGFEVANEITTEREGGDGQEAGFRYKTLIHADGGAAVNARPEVTGRAFAWTLGNDASVGIVATTPAVIANHLCIPAATLPYITVEQRFADEIERFANGQFTSLNVSGEAGQPIKITANYISGGTIYQRDVASTLTATRETNKPFMYPGGSYQFDAAGSYATKVTKWSIDVTRNVDDQVQTVGINREDVVPMNFDVGIDATLKYETRDYYQKVSYGVAGSQVPIDLATGSFRANTLAGSYMLEVGVPFLTWNDAKVNKLDPDGKTTYLDVSGQTLKNACYAIYAIVGTDELTAY